MDERYFKYEESDWNLYLIKIKEWQERYISNLNKEYISILKKEGTASDNFLELMKRVEGDKNYIAVNPPKRKPNMFDNIFSLLLDKVIDIKDLDGFSLKLINDLTETLRIYYYNMYNIKYENTF